MNVDGKEKLEQSIREQFREPCGIIELLHANHFEQTKYKKFYNTFEQYYDLIKNENTISREIAGYFQTFHIYLYSATNCSDETPQSSGRLRELEKAWSETLDLMFRFYPEA